MRSRIIIEARTSNYDGAHILQTQAEIAAKAALTIHSTGNSGAVLQPGESWQPPAAQSQGFAPQTLQGQLLLSGKPPLNLARYPRAESLSLRLP